MSLYTCDCDADACRYPNGRPEEGDCYECGMPFTPDEWEERHTYRTPGHSDTCNCATCMYNPQDVHARCCGECNEDAEMCDHGLYPTEDDPCPVCQDEDRRDDAANHAYDCYREDNYRA